MSREVYRCSDVRIEVFPSRDHLLFFAGAVSSKNWLVFVEALNYAPDVGDASVVSLTYGRSWSDDAHGTAPKGAMLNWGDDSSGSYVFLASHRLSVGLATAWVDIGE